MMMTNEQTKVAFTMNAKNNDMNEVRKIAKHLADLHNRRNTEKTHALKLVENIRKERFSTLISKQDFQQLYLSYK